MKRFRFHPMRTRFAILAIVGLLWAQLALAAHPLCSAGAGAMTGPTMALAAGEDGCPHEQAPPADESDQTLCVAHCSRGDLTNDVARVPVVPALPAAVPAAFVPFVFVAADPAPHSALPPPVSWHRPTTHPAALLLI